MKVIITGHSRGLGAAIAAHLLSRNIAVLGIARTGNAELEKQYPDILEQCALDLSDTTALAHWLAGDTLRRFLANCDDIILMNNAGTVQPVGPLEMQDIAAISRAIGLNVAAPMMLASAVAAASAGAKSRRILHVSSGAGQIALPGWSVYCATKAALDHHARAAAADRSPSLRICSLAPGVIDTQMQAEIRAVSLERFPLRESFEAMNRNGELSSPQECAKRLVAYVLDEQFGQHPVADLCAFTG